MMKAIEGFPGYFVTESGQISSEKSNKFLSDRPNTHGYPTVTVYNNKKIRRIRVHREVAKAFLACPDPTLDVNHKDGIKTNNHVSNLEWCTRKENERHSREILGNRKEGEGHGQAKVSNDDVVKIRELYSTGNYYQREIAELFNVSQMAISNIVNKRTWDHV